MSMTSLGITDTLNLIESLKRQLALLESVSETASPSELPALTNSMIALASFLLDAQ